MASPSLHESGARYEWLESRAPWEIPFLLPLSGCSILLLSQHLPPVRRGQATPGATRKVVVDPDHRPTYPEIEARAEPIVAGCAAIEQAYTKAEEISEFWWKMALSVIGRTTDGRHLAMVCPGSMTNRYSELDVDRALDRILNEMSGPFTCNAFAEECPDVCGSCTFRHTVATPLQLGGEETKLAIIQRGIVYVTEEDVYYDFDRQLVRNRGFQGYLRSPYGPVPT